MQSLLLEFLISSLPHVLSTTTLKGYDCSTPTYLAKTNPRVGEATCSQLRQMRSYKPVQCWLYEEDRRDTTRGIRWRCAEELRCYKCTHNKQQTILH